MTAPAPHCQPEIEPFHPDSNLPGCMMPDGGECCAGHAAVCEDWHKQHRRIEELTKALEEIEGLDDRELAAADLRQHDRHAGWNSGVRDCAEIARGALGISLEQEKSHG